MHEDENEDEHIRMSMSIMETVLKMGPAEIVKPSIHMFGVLASPVQSCSVQSV